MKIIKNGKQLRGKEVVAQFELDEIHKIANEISDFISVVLSLEMDSEFTPLSRLNALRKTVRMITPLDSKLQNLLEKFDTKYIDEDDKKETNFILSRAYLHIDNLYEAIEDTKDILARSVNKKASPKTAGRPKASSDKHLKDFLKGCNSDKVLLAVKEDPNKSRAGYFGLLLIALIDLGYIGMSDVGKELYEAVRNDFPEAPSISSIRKICPQNIKLIEEHRRIYENKIEDIKRIL